MKWQEVKKYISPFKLANGPNRRIMEDVHGEGTQVVVRIYPEEISNSPDGADYAGTWLTVR